MKKHKRPVLVGCSILLVLLLAGCSALATSPTIPKVEDSLMVSSNELLSLIRQGTIQENGDYTVEDGAVLVFDRSDNLKSYDLKGATIRIGSRKEQGAITIKANGMTLKNGVIAVYGDTGICVDGGKDTILSNLQFLGNIDTCLYLNGPGATVISCSFSPDEGSPFGTAIAALSADISISESTFRRADIGILDNSENGAVVEANSFSDCQTAVSVKTAGTTVWHNTIQGGKVGVQAEFEASSLSASEAVGHNILVACNQIKGAETSISFKGTSNSVLLLNQIDLALVQDCTNAYVCENTMTGKLELTGNNYLICNGNTSPELVEQNNENKNGSDVTDLSARESVGVNETLLPHVNTEQFAGMDYREMRTAKGSSSLSRYIEKAAKSDQQIIIPPGRYNGSQIDLSELEGVTVYAYGVFNEVGAADEYAVNLKKCNNCTILGMFLGYQIHPHIQGTITEVADNGGTIRFRADPGYIQDYSGIGNIEGRIFDDYECRTLIRYIEKSYDTASGINTLRGCSLWAPVAVGDRIAFRTSFSSGGFSFDQCSGIKMEDVTVFNASGFAEFDVENDVAPVLHRYAVTRGPRPVLEESPENNDSGLVTTDSYGRLRSADPLLTTIDATHSTNARTGIQLISCLFEGMDDDVTNINAYYGLASSYDSQNRVLTYGRCNVGGYKLLPASFRTGDTIEMFSLDGKHILSTTVSSDTNALVGDRYSVALPTDCVLTADQISLINSGKVVVQNRSATGNNFLIDNVKVSKVVGRVLLKGGPGIVKNSTFSGMSYNVITALPEMNAWPEVGYVHDLQILNNVFDGNNRRAASSADWMRAGNMVDIQITGVQEDVPVTKQEDCMHSNIIISGNVFQNRWAQYAIRINAARVVVIRDNQFQPKAGETAATDQAVPILLCGGTGITVENNTCPPNALSTVENRLGATSVTGNDIR